MHNIRINKSFCFKTEKTKQLKIKTKLILRIVVSSTLRLLKKLKVERKVAISIAECIEFSRAKR